MPLTDYPNIDESTAAETLLLLKFDTSPNARERLIQQTYLNLSLYNEPTPEHVAYFLHCFRLGSEANYSNDELLSGQLMSILVCMGQQDGLRAAVANNVTSHPLHRHHFDRWRAQGSDQRADQNLPLMPSLP